MKYSPLAPPPPQIGNIFVVPIRTELALLAKIRLTYPPPKIFCVPKRTELALLAKIRLTCTRLELLLFPCGQS